MKAHKLKQLDKRRLRLWLAVFFISLLLPTTVLVYHAYDQLKWETYHLHRSMAEEVSNRIDNRLLALIKTEAARPFTAYSFLNVAGDSGKGFLQRSPLSNLPLKSEINGIIGYFQIGPQQQFTTPLLPEAVSDAESYGINHAELVQRQQVQTKILRILSRNRLIQDKAPVASVQSGQADAMSQTSKEETGSPAIQSIQKDDTLSNQLSFDELTSDEAPISSRGAPQGKSFGKVEDLKLESKYNRQSEMEKQAPAKKSKLRDSSPFRSKRTEKNILPEQRLPSLPASGAAPPAPVELEIFESEIDPFELARLESGQFVLYRKVWRDKQRYIQGILIEPDAFVKEIIEPTFRETTLSSLSDLSVAYHGHILAVIGRANQARYLSSTDQLKGSLLYRTSLASPLDGIELIYSIHNLPVGPGGQVIVWSSIVLLLVLSGGFLLMYRLGLRQISLGRQQQDFVSAISHELKTPLTSIRMYGEMLREGWAEEDKKKAYYDYIFAESERLTRLINNVLQLARMTRNDLKIDIRSYSLGEIIDTLRSKVTSHIEQQGFELDMQCEESLRNKHINVDMDYLIQVIINLTDNAVKFSSKADIKRIDIRCLDESGHRVRISIRDYGPGIAKDQMKKIFRLFYRSENELTRDTVGTGIGLALVNQLTHAMQGSVDVVTHEPGAEFILSFPCND